MIHLGTMNVWTKFHGNPSNICGDISIWTKVLDWLTVTASILRVLNGRIWSLYPNDRATSHLTRILEEHVCVILCTMLEANSRAVCVFQFCSSFLPFSLHVWDTVLPDCLGMGVRRITCVRVRVVSQSTSLRIDYYSSSLGVTEKATKTPSCTAWRCCCVRVNFVMWPEARLHLCDGSVSSCLSYLLPVSDTGGDLGCTNIPAS